MGRVRSLLWVLFACVLFTGGVAYANSGEFDFVVSVLEHTPAGELPVAGTLDGRAVTGSLDIDVSAEGRVIGTLSLADLGGVGLTGKLTVKRGRPHLKLRGSGVQRRLRLQLTQGVDGFYRGSVRGGRDAFAGRGVIAADPSDGEPLQARIAAATRNGFGTLRLGDGLATMGEHQIPVLAKVKQGRRFARIKFSGAGFKFTAKGTFTNQSVTFTSYKLKSHGLLLRGAGTVPFAPNGPDVVLLLASGHTRFGEASSSHPYLSDSFGPALELALRRRGYTVATDSFVDHSTGTDFGDGLDGMIQTLAAVRDAWVHDRRFPSRVVVAAHSHGGVRAHDAILAVADLPIEALIDLDTSSCLFNTGHLFESYVDPVDRFFVDDLLYDTEDVVFPNVVNNLDVRSGEFCPSILFERYDDAVNIRLDGSRAGIWMYEANSSHSEVHSVNGTTYPVVERWLLDRLAE